VEAMEEAEAEEEVEEEVEEVQEEQLTFKEEKVSYFL
jgi:hypothetical protein